MGGGTLTGDVFIGYGGSYINIFEMPKDRRFYLLNESRAEITRFPLEGRNVFSKLLTLSSLEDRKKFTAHDPRAWRYLTEEIVAVDEDKLSKEDLMRYRKR